MIMERKRGFRKMFPQRSRELKKSGNTLRSRRRLCAFDLLKKPSPNVKLRNYDVERLTRVKKHSKSLNAPCRNRFSDQSKQMRRGREAIVEGLLYTWNTET